MIQSKDRFRLIVLMILLCVLCLSIVWISAKSAEIQYDINKINSEIKNTRRDAQNLEVMIKSASNINNLENRALELGMVYPSFDEIVYLDDGEPQIQNFATAIKQTAYQ